MNDRPENILGFWARKMIHFFGITSIAVLVLFVPQNLIVPLSSICFILIFIFEYVRLKTWLRKILKDTMGGLFKKKESVKFSGLFWGALAFLILSFVVDRYALSFGIAVLGVADSAAAMIGKKFPSVKIYNKKTLNGSLACLIGAFFISVFYGFIIDNIAIRILWGAIVGSVITAIEVFSYPFDDNFIITLAAGLLMELLLNIQFTWVLFG